MPEHPFQIPNFTTRLVSHRRSRFVTLTDRESTH
jgi:hypothetical protein